MRTAKPLISLGGCPGWSESSLGTHAILLVLSWRGSFECEIHLLSSGMWWLQSTLQFELFPSHYLSHLMTKPTKWHVRPAKTEISLGIRPVWSESSLCAQWVAKDPRFLHADSEDSDQTGRMPRLIWVFAGRTCHFVGFAMRRLFLETNINRIPVCVCWSGLKLF